MAGVETYNFRDVCSHNVVVFGDEVSCTRVIVTRQVRRHVISRFVADFKSHLACMDMSYLNFTNGQYLVRTPAPLHSSF